MKTSQAHEAIFTLLSAADRVRGLLAAAVEPHGITGQQYNVLRILRGAEPEGLPTLAIAGRLIERAPGITRMIDRLEAKKLVTRERERRAGDRRRVHCRITTKGLDLLAQLDQPVDKGSRAIFGSLTAPELAQLVTLLDRTAHERVRL